jgi:hypothetical protein
MSIQPEADAPPDGAAAGWHQHPQHPTVQRYWDGSGWTGEHRFAPLEVGEDSLLPETRIDVRERLAVTWAERGGVMLGVAYGLPWIYVGAAYGLAGTVHRCSSSEPQLAFACGLGGAMWLGSLAALERGLRLLDLRMWLRVVVAALTSLYSAVFVYYGVGLIALASWCLSC